MPSGKPGGTLGFRLIAAALLLVLLCPRLQAAQIAAAPLEHATWVRYQWFAGAQTAFSKTSSPYAQNPPLLDEIERTHFARRLAQNNVHTIFVFAGSFSKGGMVPLWPVEDGSPFVSAAAPAAATPATRISIPEPPAKEAIQETKPEVTVDVAAPVKEEPAEEATPVSNLPIATLRRELDATGESIRVLAWLGGRHAGYERGHIDLSDKETRANIVKLAMRLVSPEFGFDGIHLNIEPTLNEDRNLLLLLEEVKTALPKGKVLSFAGTMVMPFLAGLPKLRERFWSEAYLREVASRTDQIAFMTYDTSITSASLFHWFLAQQAKSLARLTYEANPGCEIFFGVPSYREDSPWHRSEAENVGNATSALAEAFSEMGPERKIVKGLAIYASWTTSDEDWEIIQRAFSPLSASSPPPNEAASSGTTGP